MDFPQWTKAVLVISLALALSACGEKLPAGQAQAGGGEVVVTLGFAAPLSGPQAHYGQEYKNGVLLAIEDENAAYPRLAGKPVSFVLSALDDQASPVIARQVAQRLIDDKVSGVIGPFNSASAIAAAPLYEQAGIPQISMATAPAYTAQGFRTSFRSMPSDTHQGRVMGWYVVKNLAARKIAIIDDGTAYGQGLAQAFAMAVQAAGGKVVGHEYTTDKAIDETAILTSLKARHPDLLFFAGAGAQAATVARQMKQLGMDSWLVTGEMGKTPVFLRNAGEEGEDTITSLAGLPLDDMPKGRVYAARYKVRFKQDVATYSPYGYDAARIMMTAILQAGSADPARYLPYLARMVYTGGVTARSLAYDGNGDLKAGGMTIYKVQGGKWTVLESTGVSDAMTSQT